MAEQVTEMSFNRNLSVFFHVLSSSLPHSFFLVCGIHIVFLQDNKSSLHASRSEISSISSFLHEDLQENNKRLLIGYLLQISFCICLSKKFFFLCV